MNYITNRAGTVTLLWEPDLLEWLQQTYPNSQYHLVEYTNEEIS
jgi:hypothetical protein